TPGLRALPPPMTEEIATALGPVLDEPGALQQPSTVHVRYGSEADRTRFSRRSKKASLVAIAKVVFGRPPSTSFGLGVGSEAVLVCSTVKPQRGAAAGFGSYIAYETEKWRKVIKSDQAGVIRG